jgi:hypothetical protein
VRNFIISHISNNIRQSNSRRLKWAEHVARMGEERKLYTVLVGEPEGKRLLERPRYRWDRDRWQDAVNAVMNLRVLAPRS